MYLIKMLNLSNNMKISNVEQRSLDWLDLRKGKVTGTGLKKIVGTKLGRDSYFVEILAERLAVDDGSQESPIERGERLESSAIEAFEYETGKIVENIGFIQDDDNEDIAISPDGLIKNEGKYTEAVEIKCLSSANHIRAWIDNEVPKDYYPQVVQYFIVNRDLETLYFCLYDPRITIRPLHIITVYRQDIEDDIKQYRDSEEKFLQEVENKLSELLKI